jgi:hypothetical protein
MGLSAIHISELQLFEQVNNNNNLTSFIFKYSTLFICYTFNLLQFDKEYAEVSTYLNDIEQKFDHFTSTTSGIASWNKATCDDVVSQFGLFKHAFQVTSNCTQQIDHLYELVNKLPSFKMRKANLRNPYDKVELLTDYYLVEVLAFGFFYVSMRVL